MVPSPILHNILPNNAPEQAIGQSVVKARTANGEFDMTSGVVTAPLSHNTLLVEHTSPAPHGMAQPTPVVMEVSTGGMDVGTEQEKKAGEEGNQTNSGVVHIAVEGCSHGNLDEIYASVTALQDTHDTHVDLLIICGDFQAVRNQADLECLACPPKYRHMVRALCPSPPTPTPCVTCCGHVDARLLTHVLARSFLCWCFVTCIDARRVLLLQQGFHEYYSGKKVAPVLTIFVGGNHEASNHLQVRVRVCVCACAWHACVCECDLRVCCSVEWPRC